MMNFADVQSWENTELHKRGEDYLAFKKRKQDVLLNQIYLKFPELESAIEYIDAATPLTFRDYTATHNGSMYGIIKDFNDPFKTFISTKTRVETFFLPDKT